MDEATSNIDLETEKLIYDDFVVLLFGQNKIGVDKRNNNILNNDTISLFYEILKNEFDLIFMINE